MMYWFIEGVGLTAREDRPSGNVFEMDEATFMHCRENYEFFDIFVQEGKLHIKLNMSAYREAALAKLDNPAYIVHNNVKYYDDELGYMSETYITRSGHPCVLTQKQMIQRVTERNRLFAYKRSGINSARTPEEVEEYL